MDCWGRSNSGLGSSAKWAKTSSMGGVMSDDCKSNPDFCNFNRVHMVYCDGNSFSGNRDEPVVVKGADGKNKPLYFRGRRIIDAVLETLVSDHGLADANDVLLTGCSAGGLATYLHTDYVHEKLKTLAPKMKKFKASAISGFFLLHNTVENKPVYPTEMANIFHLANSTHGVNDACIAAMSPEKPVEVQLCSGGVQIHDISHLPLTAKVWTYEARHSGSLAEPEMSRSQHFEACFAVEYRHHFACPGTPTRLANETVPGRLKLLPQPCAHVWQNLLHSQQVW